MNAVNAQPHRPLSADDNRLELPMQELMARVLREARERQFNQLMIVGVAHQVGTSFIAQQAAEELAAAFGQVLVVEVSEQATSDNRLEGDLERLCSPGCSVAKVSLSLADALRLFGIGNADTEAFFEHLQKCFALVLWDFPPPTQSPAAMIAAKCMSGVVLVAQANRTRRQVARYAARRLQESGGELLGVVLNRSINFIPDWLYRWL